MKGLREFGFRGRMHVPISNQRPDKKKEKEKVVRFRVQTVQEAEAPIADPIDHHSATLPKLAKALSKL